MLENILKEINSNLERIANSLEKNSNISIGLDLANGKDENVVAVAPYQTEIQNSQPYISANSVNVVPQAETQPTVAQTIPTTQVQESFTQEQLAVAMSNAVSAGKMNIIQNILQQLGVQALTQVNPSDYNKVATMLKEAGVEL